MTAQTGLHHYLPKEHLPVLVILLPSRSNIQKNSLLFNEIMYEPETGKTEFIEFYNASNDSIQVGGNGIESW